MPNKTELVIARTTGFAFPKEKLEMILSFLPDEELTPFAVQGEDNGENFTVFGFSTTSVSEKLTEENLDVFNMMVLKESKLPIPAGKHKAVRLLNVNMIILG